MSFAFALYLLEGYLTFIKISITNLDKKIKIYKQNTGKEYDDRTMLQIYVDKLNKNENIVVHVGAKSYIRKSNKELHPLSGISNSNTILCNENGYHF